jgi:hypothetical protein
VVPVRGGAVVAAVELTFSVACATVFGLAGLLKLRDDAALAHRALACAELAVAVSLLTPRTRGPALLAASALAGAFFVHSLQAPDRPCRCFGQRFEPMSRRARMGRNASLLAVALAASVSAATSGLGALTGVTTASEHTSLAATAVVTGVLLGLSMVLVPWLPGFGSPIGGSTTTDDMEASR